MSLTNADVLESLRVGDVVRVTRTLKVAGPYLPDCDIAWGEDVGSGGNYLIDNSKTLKIEIVKKAAPAAKKRTDYKVGDVVTGDQLRATQWLRGTIIKNVGASGSKFILLPFGYWTYLQELNEPFADEYGFQDFTAPEYVIEYLP